MKAMVLSCMLVLLSCPWLASAGTLGPTAASQVVTLRMTSDHCAGAENVFAFDEQLTPSATRQPFTVPSKQVFVLTQVRAALVAVQGSPLGSAGSAGILIANSSGDQTIDEVQASPDSSGNFTLNVNFSPGVVIGSGSLPCISTFGTKYGILDAHAFGFMAKDK